MEPISLIFSLNSQKDMLVTKTKTTTEMSPTFSLCIITVCIKNVKTLFYEYIEKSKSAVPP